MTTRGFNHLYQTLGRVSGAYRAALAESATVVKGIAATYPPTRSRKLADLGGPRLKGGFWSRRQQRFFFAALRDGTIQVPYRRGSSPGSQKLGSQWQIRIGQYDAHVFNLTRYGLFVQGTKDQSLYHAGNWKTERQIANESKPGVLAAFTAQYRRAIRG